MDNFTHAYICCALWSSTDANGEPLDRLYGIGNIAPEALQAMENDCKAFQEAHADLLARAYDVYSHSSEWSHAAQAGHDFWLTRNRHGAGFWDGDLPEDIGKQLTAAAHTFGECNLYVGDDGKVYL